MITIHPLPPGAPPDGVERRHSARHVRRQFALWPLTAWARANESGEPTAASAGRPDRHDTLREGVGLGLLLATSTWLWIVAVDAIAGQPFFTFSVLGGIALFTTAHFALNVAYGVAIVAAVHAAAEEPSWVMALGFGSILLEFAFGMLTAVAEQLGVGRRAWVGLLGGSLLALLMTVTVLGQRHPLATWLHDAEEAR